MTKNCYIFPPSSLDNLVFSWYNTGARFSRRGNNAEKINAPPRHIFGASSGPSGAQGARLRMP